MIHQLVGGVAGIFERVVEKSSPLEHVPGAGLRGFDFHADREIFALLAEGGILVGDKIAPPVALAEIHPDQLSEPAPVVRLDGVVDVAGLEISGKIVGRRRKRLHAGRPEKLRVRKHRDSFGDVPVSLQNGVQRRQIGRFPVVAEHVFPDVFRRHVLPENILAVHIARIVHIEHLLADGVSVGLIVIDPVVLRGLLRGAEADQRNDEQRSLLHLRQRVRRLLQTLQLRRPFLNGVLLILHQKELVRSSLRRRHKQRIGNQNRGRLDQIQFPHQIQSMSLPVRSGESCRVHRVLRLHLRPDHIRNIQQKKNRQRQNQQGDQSKNQNLSAFSPPQRNPFSHSVTPDMRSTDATLPLHR